MTSKQVIIEETYHNRISKFQLEGGNKILIQIWHPDGCAYIYVKETEDILKLKRFFESIEVEQKTE